MAQLIKDLYISPEEDVKKVIKQQLETHKKEREPVRIENEQSSEIGKSSAEVLLAIVNNKEQQVSSYLYDQDNTNEATDITKITSIEKLEEKINGKKHWIIFKHELLPKFQEKLYY